MCGIAGMVDLAGERTPSRPLLERMAGTIIHRGPDEEGFHIGQGVGLASRRLSIVGLADGRQPITNEDGSIVVVFNGEIFDYPELRSRLEGRGHRFTTHCDTEVIPHLYEDYGEGLLEHLKGQFAFALWDSRRHLLLLARDRFGICPLFWTKQATGDGEWLLFASEIKAILATNMVDPRPDVMGINHVFTFFAQPGPQTCFLGIRALTPGHFLRVDLSRGATTRVAECSYWRMDFPDRGQETSGPVSQLVDGFEAVLRESVAKRLRADVPVVSYLSGGVDSSTVVALAGRERGKPIPTFTIQIDDPLLDETSEAGQVARHLGCKPTVVRCGADDVLSRYPQLIATAETPVVDTACTALMMLAEEVHSQGYKVALTGEGADEWLAGYPWYRTHRILGCLDVIPGLRLSQLTRRAYLRLTRAPRFPWALTKRTENAVAGPNAWLDIYGLMSMAKFRFYSRSMYDSLADHVPYADLGLDLDRMRRWHPLNRSLAVGARVMLPGLLLASKGDRVAMRSSVETRYPFLDEKVFDYLAPIHPKWKLRGLREKYLLRVLAERWLPRETAWRRKAMFRAPFDSFHGDAAPAFVEQLLSPASLERTGYFDAASP
jgi:asparagine synthase (glutamine-hydrolysing)